MKDLDKDLIKEYLKLIEDPKKNKVNFRLPNSGEPFDDLFEKHWKDGGSSEYERIVDRLNRGAKDD